MGETIRVDTGVRGRPEKHNAMSAASIAELHETASELARRMRSGERGDG